MTEQFVTGNTAPVPRDFTQNSVKINKVGFDVLNLDRRHTVFGLSSPDYKQDFRLDFTGGRLVASNYRLDLAQIVVQVVPPGIYPMTVVTRANGTWSGDGADWFTPGSHVAWPLAPGPDLGTRSVRMEITAAIGREINACEVEHVIDFTGAWFLTVGMVVAALPADGYPSAAEALRALAGHLSKAGRPYLIPETPDQLNSWAPHLKSCARRLSDQSDARDASGSHSPTGYLARLEDFREDGPTGSVVRSCIVLTPQFPARPQIQVLDPSRL